MYTFCNLGSLGRLGNQLFQYAALFGIGVMNGKEIGIPAGSYPLLEAFPGLSARRVDYFPPHRRFMESSYRFDPSVWLTPDGTDYYGYFQSPYYFQHCEARLREEFVFAPRWEREAAEFLGRTAQGPLCAVHVRRTDYLDHQEFFHILTPDNYYNQALEIIRAREPRAVFLVFSDDLAHCKATFPAGFLFSPGTSPFFDLCLMSRCQMHVIANSSLQLVGCVAGREYNRCGTRKMARVGRGGGLGERLLPPLGPRVTGNRPGNYRRGSGPALGVSPWRARARAKKLPGTTFLIRCALRASHQWWTSRPAGGSPPSGRK